MNQRPIFALLFVLLLSLPSRAQDAQDKPVQPPDATPVADVADAARRAQQIIDQIDSDLDNAPERETLLELEKLVETIQNSEPAHPMLSYYLGRAYALAGRSGDAIDQLRKFVQTRDGRMDWKAHRVLGDLFVNEFPRLAQGSYEKAAQLNPNEPSVLTGLSMCAARAGNLDEALRLARQAAQVDGFKNVRFVHRLAKALSMAKLWEEADKEATRALKLAEEKVREKPGKRVPIQILLEQYGLASEVLAARIGASTSTDAQLYLRLSDLLGARGGVMERSSWFDQLAIMEGAVAKTAPETPVVLRIRYAELLAKVGRTQDAIAEYEKVLAAEPGNSAAGEALTVLRKEGALEVKPDGP